MKILQILRGAGTRRFAVAVIATLLFVSPATRAAIVNPSGYTNAFGTQPPATDWATLSIAGGSGDSYSVDAEVNALITAGGVTTPTTGDSGNPPSANVNGMWSSTGLYLQTRPTNNRFTALMAKFVNGTGSNVTQISLSYLFTIASGGTSEENGRGTRAYFSLSGFANSWINIPALNTTAYENGTSTMVASVALNWTNGGNLFLLWADDNSTSGTDAADQYDNFSLRATAGTTTNFFSIVTAPTNGAALPSDAPITTTALTANATPPYSVEYFTNSGAGNTVFASAGVSATAPYNVNLGTLPVGTYRIYAVTTDSSGIPRTTNSVTNTFTVANPMTFTLIAPLDGAMFEHTNSVLGAATVSGGTAPYSVQFYLDNVANGAPRISPPYERNFGALPVGDHTVRATVTDANGWVSNSSVSTIHVSGPLAVNLAPAHGAVFPAESSLALAASIAGGTSSYTATFYVNAQLAGTRSAPPYTTNLGVLPSGSYTCYVHATDNSLPVQEAYSLTNVITILPPPLRVMPVGDSITFGLPVAGGYRAPLYQLLTNAGHLVDFIGTQTGNGASSLPDLDHEGYSGAIIEGIDSDLPGIYSSVVAPDIILVLIGVNDYRIGNETDQATNRLEALVEHMAANWPGAKIIVGNLLPLNEPYNTQIQTTYNPLLPGLCERQRALGRQVYFTDIRSVVQLADLPDQLHPNQFGYNKMATNWFAAINFVQSLCSNCPPAFVTHPTNQNVQPGTNVTLVANAIGAVGSGLITYQWRFNGTNIPNATNATYSFTNASLQHLGRFSAVASNAFGAATSSNAFINVLIRPGFVLNPVAQSVLQGRSATFTAIATGAPPIWYRWLSNGVGIITNNTGVLVITNLQSSYTIRLTATNLASGLTGVNMSPSTGVSLTMLPDFDQDGMADAWERLFEQFGFRTNDASDAVLDFDGDGLINRAEYVSGTNPTNALSVLKLTLTSVGPGGPGLEFIAQSNVAYTIQQRTNLAVGLWERLTNISAQSQVRTMQVAAPNPPLESERYFRLVTPPIP